MHLGEAPGLHLPYIDPAYREWVPVWTGGPGVVPLSGGVEHWQIKGRPVRLSADSDPMAPDSQLGKERFPRIQPYLNEQGSIDADGQLRAMDVEGVDVAVLFPSGSGIPMTQSWIPPDAQLALARAYNSWLADFCKADPARLKVNALLPVGDLDAAVAEIRRAATELGAVSVAPQNLSHAGNRRLDDPIYEPLWTEAERHGVAVAFHGHRGGHFRERYKDSVPLAYVNGRGIEHAVAFSELLYGGVLERHPELRIVFLEAGCTWVLYWVSRLEEIWEKFRKVSPDLDRNVRMRPVDYWRRQCYSAVEVEEWTLAQVIDGVGDDNLVVSTDFPHFDTEFPDAGRHFMEIPGVSRESKRKILWDNCARLYNVR
jgi:predicted TIM-barrel fold metal-dependent hydrolase